MSQPQDAAKREPNDELRKLMKELIVEGAKYGYNNSSNTGSYELTPNQDKYADELVDQGMKEIEQYAYEYAWKLFAEQSHDITSEQILSKQEAIEEGIVQRLFQRNYQLRGKL